jgi:hypothetical protein
MILRSFLRRYNVFKMDQGVGRGGEAVSGMEGSLRLLRKGQEKNHDSQNAPLSWYENLGQCNAFMYK